MEQAICEKDLPTAIASALLTKSVAGVDHTMDANALNHLPELLADQVLQFRAISGVWFEREVRSLIEPVGMDYFPSTAAEFLWRLLGILLKTIPDLFALRELKRARPAPDEDIRFCEPQSDVPA